MGGLQLTAKHTESGSLQTSNDTTQSTRTSGDSGIEQCTVNDKVSGIKRQAIEWSGGAFGCHKNRSFNCVAGKGHISWFSFYHKVHRIKVCRLA